MIFPIGTDEPIRRQAWCTYAIIAVTVLCFFLANERVVIPIDPSGVPDQTTHLVVFNQWRIPTWMPLKNPGFEWYQLFTYQVAHADIVHLAMNMLFLFAIGRALENKLGHVKFTAIYAIGGVVAGFGHILTTHAPVIGSSGAVCAVAGAFLALLPNATVRVAYFFFVTMGVLDVTGLTFVLSYFCLDLIMTVMSIRSAQGSFGVAYTAHVSGYLFGTGVGLLLLKFKVVPTGHNDLLYIINQYRRRQEFRKQIQGGSKPWMSNPGPAGQGMTGEPITPEKEQVMQLRGQITRKAQAGELDEACELHGQLMALDAAQTLPRQVQHDLANHHYAMGKHAQAAAAYERFLETYPADLDRNQVQLMLTVLYARYLGEGAKARAILDELTPRLTNEEHRELARGLRDELA